MNRDELIENLRTTLLWETVCAQIEHGKEANVILQKAGVENGVAAECAEIQDSEDFFVTDVCESGGRIAIDFEMPFILCVNNKYHIEATAEGKLDIPNTGNYPYDSHDFVAMGKEELLSFGGIVRISSITYSDVELLGMSGEKIGERIADFLEEVKAIRWFENSGRPNEKYDMVFSLYEACDGLGKQYTEAWESQIYPLENIAVKKIGDDSIDDAFETVSAAIGDTVWEKFGEFIDRQRLGNELAVCDELFDRIMRDMAWACVEKILDMPGFFTMLAEIYKEGYFPCSWNGEYPSGQAVVL